MLIHDHLNYNASFRPTAEVFPSLVLLTNANQKQTQYAHLILDMLAKFIHYSY